jgi:UDP-N-acetylglucosamine--N-acetylmuramyl-(pentapeptide) pyrophosphoryl-undecaprenol N-acetylglucosamine transferase
MSEHDLDAAGPPQGVKAPMGGSAAHAVASVGAHSRCALIMAGGTGGHIFPGLAVAQALRERGWRVHWMGASDGMERRLVPAKGFPLEAVAFSGVRGKGLRTLLALPLRLLRAMGQSRQVLRRVKPDVLVGLGGYITMPGGLMGVLMGKPLVLHEQNSVAGLSNRILAVLARRVFTAFPEVLKKGQWVGNPLRDEFLVQAAPAERFAGRTGPLRVLVVGGSLGARALNDVVPQALALIPEAKRPWVTHQSGETQIDELRSNYAAAGVQAELTPFIDNTAQAFADADWVICRAGASTVTEIAAVGAPALFVPFPSAVDDHQTHNARFLVDQGAGWLIPQSELTPGVLADLLQKTERSALLARGLEAKKLQQLRATDAVVAACEELCT